MSVAACLLLLLLVYGFYRAIISRPTKAIIREFTPHFTAPLHIPLVIIHGDAANYFVELDAPAKTSVYSPVNGWMILLKDDDGNLIGVEIIAANGYSFIINGIVPRYYNCLVNNNDAIGYTEAEGLLISAFKHKHPAPFNTITKLFNVQ